MTTPPKVANSATVDWFRANLRPTLNASYDKRHHSPTDQFTLIIIGVVVVFGARLLWGYGGNET
jgi:hypothetical protein